MPEGHGVEMLPVASTFCPRSPTRRPRGSSWSSWRALSAGPLQLRNTFKFFDRDGSGGISLSEIRWAFAHMGFTFKDIEVAALYAQCVAPCHSVQPRLPCPMA